MKSEPSTTCATFIEDAISAWGDTVYRVALNHTGSVDDAEDVYQDVFERLLATTRSFASSEHLKAWLIRVTINRCHDLAKSHHRSRTDPLDMHSSEVSRKLSVDNEAEGNRNDTHSELAAALDQLPDDQRDALGYFYRDGLSTDEIAKVTGATPGAVRTKLYRARKALKCALTASMAILLAVGTGLIATHDNRVASTPYTQPAPAAIPNFFALRAWGNPESDDAPTAITPVNPMGVNWIHPQYWSENYNPEDPFEEGSVELTGLTCTTFNFDALCTGSNIATIRFETNCSDALLSYNGISPALDAYRDPAPSVTIDYHDPAEVEASSNLVINVVLPVEGRTRALYDSVIGQGDYERYWSEVVPAGFIDAAEALAGSDLVLTATFEDGTTQTKAYRISLAPDYEKRAVDLVSALIGQWEHNDGQAFEHDTLPALLVLYEVSNNS